jgi:hypothetical protein
MYGPSKLSRKMKETWISSQLLSYCCYVSIACTSKMCELPAGWIRDVSRKNGRQKLTGFVKSTMRTTTSTSKNLADKVTIGTTTNYETKKK